MNFKSAHWGKREQQFKPRLLQGGFQEENHDQTKQKLPEWLRIKEPESHASVTRSPKEKARTGAKKSATLRSVKSTPVKRKAAVKTAAKKRKAA